MVFYVHFVFIFCFYSDNIGKTSYRYSATIHIDSEGWNITDLIIIIDLEALVCLAKRCGAEWVKHMPTKLTMMAVEHGEPSTRSWLESPLGGIVQK